MEKSKSKAGSSRGGTVKKSSVHVVRRGDSLWSIARRYGVTINQLSRWNGLDKSSVLRPGQRVRLTG